MTIKEFDKIISERCDFIVNIFILKAKEYRRNNNPFHNFEMGAQLTNTNPLRVLDGFLLKHLISYRDMLNDIEKGNIPNEEYVNEKFGDIINYFILQEAQIKKLIKNK